MFSTLLGALPPLPTAEVDPAAGIGAVIERNVADLEATGLALLTDGLGAAGPDVPPDALVARWRAARDSTVMPVKAVVLGPWSASRRPDEAPSPLDAALSSRALVDALAAAGCPLVEIAEPDALSIATDAADRDGFVAAHHELVTGVTGVHLSLAMTGGNFDAAGPETFFGLPYASYAFDLISGPDNWRLVTAAPTDRGIVCGALDPRPDGDESRELLVWAAHYAASSAGRGLNRVGLANAFSLEAGSRELALRKLSRLAEGARVAAVESAAEMASLLDPRALGLRRPGRPAASRGTASSEG